MKIISLEIVREEKRKRTRKERERTKRLEEKGIDDKRRGGRV